VTRSAAAGRARNRRPALQRPRGTSRSVPLRLRKIAPELAWILSVSRAQRQKALTKQSTAKQASLFNTGSTMSPPTKFVSLAFRRTQRRGVRSSSIHLFILQRLRPYPKQLCELWSVIRWMSETEERASLLEAGPGQESNSLTLVSVPDREPAPVL
jgi:hypothetical protein